MHGNPQLQHSCSQFLRFVCSLTILACLTGCHHVGYDFDRKNFANVNEPGRKIRTYAALNFYDSEESEPYVVKFSRMNKNYVASAPLYQEAGTEINFTAERNKEFKNFLGMRGRWEF